MVPRGEIAAWACVIGKAVRVSWKLKGRQEPETVLRERTPSPGSEGSEGWGIDNYFSLSIERGSSRNLC